MRTWRSLTALTKVEVRNMFRNVVPLVFNLLAPVSFLVIFGLIFGKGQTSARPLPRRSGWAPG